MKYYKDMIELIGKTPLVRVNKLNENANVLLLAKLEKFNPMGSVKDRAAKYMIEKAEKDGTLTKDKTIIEPTSGNTGIALTMIAAIKGYKIDIVMSTGMSVERKQILKALGANIIGTPPEKGTDGAIELAEKLSKKENYFMPFQFSNEANTLAHYETTAEEIWNDTDGKITHAVVGVGTTGTIMGVSKKLKEKNPEIKVIGVQPLPNARIQGLKNLETERVPEIYKPGLIDEVRYVNEEDSYETAREMAKKEGMFTGMSSGAAMYVAIQKARELKEGLIVVILPDGGEKYLSTPLYR